MCWNHPEWLIISVDTCSTFHLLLKGSGYLETFSHAGIHLSDFALWLLILDIYCIFKRIRHSFHIYLGLFYIKFQDFRSLWFINLWRVVTETFHMWMHLKIIAQSVDLKQLCFLLFRNGTWSSCQLSLRSLEKTEDLKNFRPWPSLCHFLSSWN